jgi:hypothetical protein
MVTTVNLEALLLGIEVDCPVSCHSSYSFSLNANGEVNFLNERAELPYEN